MDEKFPTNQKHEDPRLIDDDVFCRIHCQLLPAQLLELEGCGGPQPPPTFDTSSISFSEKTCTATEVASSEHRRTIVQ